MQRARGCNRILTGQDRRAQGGVIEENLKILKKVNADGSLCVKIKHSLQA